MRRRPLKDRAERKHRRTWRHPESVAFMASADFDAVPSLAEAMGMDEPERGEPREQAAQEATAKALS